jgi:hypothetical protein
MHAQVASKFIKQNLSLLSKLLDRMSLTLVHRELLENCEDLRELLDWWHYDSIITMDYCNPWNPKMEWRQVVAGPMVPSFHSIQHLNKIRGDQFTNTVCKDMVMKSVNYYKIELATQYEAGYVTIGPNYS